MRKRTNSVLEAIGDTPLVKLNRVVPEGAADVYVKLEYYNPTGSYKDRFALSLIEEAEKRGDLRPGMTVVEFTGGSTGSSLALVCSVKGYRIRLVTSNAFAAEKLNTMRALGAELTMVHSETGKVTPDLLPRMREIVKQYLAEPDTYWTDQFNNHDAHIGYAAIGREVLEQLDGKIDVFCGGVGTAGMMMGAASVLRKHTPKIELVVLEPASSPMITQGVAGSHGVEGIAMGIVPPLLNPAMYDRAMTVQETDARRMTRRLAREEGIFTGVSAGLNVAAAVQIATELGQGHTVVTVACDTGLKYLAGDLYRDDSIG